MTLINWIGILIAFSLFIAYMILNVYYKKKLKNIDGFIGIVSTVESVDEDSVNFETMTFHTEAEAVYRENK